MTVTQGSYTIAFRRYLVVFPVDVSFGNIIAKLFDLPGILKQMIQK